MSAERSTGCVRLRRLSLDTMAMDSDGGGDDEGETLNSLFESTQGTASSTCTSCPADETDGPGPRASRLTSRPPRMVGRPLGQTARFVNKSRTGRVQKASTL